MTFLTSIRLTSRDELPDEFPFSLPIIRALDEMTFDAPVTFFVGENATGKSTLLEAIAAGLNCIAVGSADVGRDDTLGHARRLADALTLVRHGARPNTRLFFRAEDIFGFTRRIGGLIDELGGLATGYEAGSMAADGVVAERAALVAKYGADPDAKSHGETFLDLFRSRLVPAGLYLLDEPETPLSPLRQLAFLAMLKEMVAQSCQFIIATHSPILMAFPDATILGFDAAPVRPVAYDDVEHVSLTKAFLQNPEGFLKRL